MGVRRAGWYHHRDLRRQPERRQRLRHAQRGRELRERDGAGQPWLVRLQQQPHRPEGRPWQGRERLGLHDMLGNVWEWTWDRYDAAGAASGVNPQNTTTGTNRAIRGGDWSASPSGLRAASRFYYALGGRGSSVGFRAVMWVP